MNLRILLTVLGIAGSLGTLVPAVADDVDALPSVKTQNGITYLSGGIGKDQSDAMKAAAKDYTLMLTCATAPDGKYLADVKVSIKDMSGSQVLETVTDGPFLLAQLKPGRYRISAEVYGEAVSKTVNISAHHLTRVNLSWPEQAVQSIDYHPGL